MDRSVIEDDKNSIKKIWDKSTQLRNELFGSCFLKLYLLRAFFENIKNTKIDFSKNYSYYLNLLLFVFFRTKKIGNHTCFICFCFICF